ncbi:MAG: hypothetical protein ACR2GH_15320 [Pseudonocardia sp.]
MSDLARASDTEAADPQELPAGVSHLLVADGAPAPGHWKEAYVAVCGALMRGSDFRSSSFSLEYEREHPLYCSECVREASCNNALFTVSEDQPDPRIR